jgi:glucose-6-phosphate dehydrogenase assembly protein OpcA
MQTEPAAADISIGMPVEVSQIHRELKKLWDEGGEVMTRASLINFAVYSEAPGSLAQNTRIMSEVTKEHACRAIVIAAHCSAAEDAAQAWISAHCHISRAGGKQVCSEQLSFLLEGSFSKLLPNIVFSHLDSDLPFYLWWQGDLPNPIDPQLWTWVDRLIYDSAEWQDFGAQMQLAETARAEANHRIVLCDLNWTRLILLRLALAQFFDHADAQQQLAKLERVEIEFAPGFRSTAILLVGWLATQLGWTLGAAENSADFTFLDRGGKPVVITLTETAGEPIGRCSLFTTRSEFRVIQPAGADLLTVSGLREGKELMRQLMPAGRNDPVHLVREELMRGGPHGVYLRAVESVRTLL